MNYLEDFKQIIEDRFLSDNEANRLIQLDPHDINDFKETVNSFKKYSAYELRIVEDLLKNMTLLSCFKAVLKMKISNNIINDSKNSERKYVQARGAVPFEKGKRKWVGHYLGPFNEIVGNDGKIKLEKLAEGDAMVRQKVLAKLREGYVV